VKQKEPLMPSAFVILSAGGRDMAEQSWIKSFVPQVGGQIQMAFEISPQVEDEFQAQLVRELDVNENAEVVR
jgi:hypothetical protein